MENTELRSPAAHEKRSRRHLHADQLPFVPPLAAGLLRLLHRSCQYTIVGKEYEAEAMRFDGPKLLTCWHFAYPLVVHYFRDRNAMIMVSRSRDGEWAARILKQLGYQCFRGSPGKGGARALLQIINQLKNAPGGGFVADGSQGPALIAQKGILLLARYTGSPLIPMSVAAKPCWRLNSWDRTLVVKPFSRVTLAFGPPIWVKKDASPQELEAARRELEDCLNDLTLQAERRL